VGADVAGGARGVHHVGHPVVGIDTWVHRRLLELTRSRSLIILLLFRLSEEILLERKPP
jgi:hypothetical protein